MMAQMSLDPHLMKLKMMWTRILVNFKEVN